MSIIFPLFLLYGIAASLTFYYHEGLRRFKPAQAVHLAVFGGLFYLYITFAADSLGGSAGRGVAIGAAAILMGLVLCCAANAVAFACIAGEYAAAMGRWLMSYDKIPELKTYDLAEAAVKNEQYDRAVRLYRKKISEDPDDIEAYRRLAEVLVKKEWLEDAVTVFQAGMNRADTARDRCRMAFRLAEVLHDRLGRPEEGAELYRMIAEEYPDDRRAEHAESRLQRMDASPSSDTDRDKGGNS